MIFADKVILYEGDTERLYIRKLLGMTEFASLRDNYIAFIQVGGAYAHNYLEILTMLKMKSLIITDLDYNKDATTFQSKNFDYPEKPLKYKHIRRISD